MRRLHYDWAHALVGFVGVLCYTHLWTAPMIAKEGVLAGVTKRFCEQISFYKFGKIYTQVAELTPVHFYFGGTEPGTSKTCAPCGTINVFLGSSKHFDCNVARCGCGNMCGRDSQGATDNLTANGVRLHGHT